MPLSNDELLALALFALAGSFTPGPNNTIAVITGANHGLRAAVPHIAGVPFGFASMLIAAAGGAAALLLAVPAAAATLKWLGVAYLLWLALGLAREALAQEPGALPAGAGVGGGPFRIPLTFAQSALFQYLNPKAWLLVAATAGVWFSGEQALARGTLAALVFATTAVASLLVWAAAGAALRAWLARGQRLRGFNLLMGTLLAATALWMGLR
jgi:threonine/homoserine/homoserine lactone efflux protein